MQDSFHCQQRILEAKLTCAETSITHDGKRGDVSEKYFLKMLRAYLPNRYSVDSAIVIDSNGKTSQQIDIVIYDRQYTPTLLDQEDHKYVPAEAVYAVMEVKPEINKDYIEYAGEKAESVRCLHRTSIPIPHAGGEFNKKALFEITAGLIAAKAAWKDGLRKSFQKNINVLKGKKRLDFVLAVNTASYDVFDSKGKPKIVTGKNVLIFSLFRLLKNLQSLATVPAIDWDAYAAQLANTTNGKE